MEQQQISYKQRVWNTLSQDAFLLVNKTIMKKYGVYAAILLSDLISKDKYFTSKDQTTEDGWFFNTEIDREQDTTLSPYQQASVIKKLAEKQILFVERRGLPARQYFKINYKRINKQLASNNTIVEEPGTSPQKTKELDPKELEDLSSRNSRTINKDKYNKNKFNKNKDITLLRKDNINNGSAPDPNVIDPTFSDSNQPSSIKRSRSNDPAYQEHPTVTPLIDYWNTLPNVTHHHRLNTKTRTLACRYLLELRAGTFYRKNSLDIAWLRKHGIDPSKIVNHRFTDTQIQRGLKLISRLLTRGYGWTIDKGPVGGFWPSEDARNRLPLSLPALLFNPQSRKSWFLRCFYDPPQHMDQLTPKDPDPETTQLFLSLIPYRDTLTPQQKTSLIYCIQSIKQFHDRQIDWQEAQCHSCINMYLGSKDRPKNFYKHYAKWLQNQCEECNLRINPSNIGPRSSNWPRFCQYFYDEHGFSLMGRH